MSRKALALPILVLAGFIWPRPAVAENLRPAVECIPQNAALVLEITQPAAFLDPLLSPEMAAAASRLATGQKPNPKLQELKGVVAYLESQLGVDWRTGLRRLIGGGLTVGTDTAGGALLLAEGQDDKLLKQLHEIIRQFAASEAEKQNQAERVISKEHNGATTWTFGPNEAHAIVGKRLFLANRAELLERALDLRGAPARNITSSPIFQAARQAVGKDAVASAFLNLEGLRHVPGLQKALADDANPLGALLFGDTKAALRNANWLALGFYVQDGSLVLRTFTDGKADDTAKSVAFSQPRGPDEGVFPNLNVPGKIASFSFCRDLRAYYAAKDDLFPERTSGLVFFENMMGIFFSGIDLTEGVLAELRPDFRIVAATQQYDSAIGTPVVQMPAFAAVLRLRDPQKFGETVEEAWQKALGLVNFTRGQKALPGLVIDRASHGDVKYTVSYYRPPGDKDKGPVDSRYNYRPSFARPGDYLVISSTDGLTKDLIDALKQESARSIRPSPAAHSLAEIDGSQLRAILAVNRENLVRQNMVDKGNTREKAETDVGVLLTALDFLDRARLSLGRDHGCPQATLELKLKIPTGKPPTTTALRN